jgi:hypothetical protein
MADADASPDPHVLRLTTDELVWLNNALNEVCNGIAIDDAAFSTRLGGSRHELKALLARIQRMLQE